MNPTEQYIHDRNEQVRKNMRNDVLRLYKEKFTGELIRTNYTKNFTWMGIPILQYPTDIMVMQELIWQIKPDYIIETGVAFGGMIVFYASMLEAISGPQYGMVAGIDKEIRIHNLTELKNHPLWKRIELFEKDSVDPKFVEWLRNANKYRSNILVSLDSNHTHDHVLQELRLYSPLVSVGSYIVVFDTAIEFFGHLDKNQNRPWGKANNPYSAVQEFMKGNKEFIVDREVEMRAGITAAPSGWLRRVK
jgi:cephalosporin hydroxylase